MNVAHQLTRNVVTTWVCACGVEFATRQAARAHMEQALHPPKEV